MVARAPVAWIFQATPGPYNRTYNLPAGLLAFDEDVWLARERQGALRMSPGQRAYVWFAGSQGGLLADGHILSNPEFAPAPPAQLPYRTPAAQASAAMAEWRVHVRYRRKLPKGAITRRELLGDPAVRKQRPIAPPHVGTNFAVYDEAVEARLQDLIAERLP